MRTRMKVTIWHSLLVLVLFTYCISCNPSQTKSKIALPLAELKVEWPYLMWSGDSYRTNGDWEADWEVTVSGGDSISIIKYHTRNNGNSLIEDTEFYRGRLVRVAKNKYEIWNGECVSAWGCSKPLPPYLYADSVPIYIDSVLLPRIKGSTIEGCSQNGNCVYVPIDSTLCIFRSLEEDGTEDQSDYYVTLTSPTKSGIAPLKFKTGSRCAAHIRYEKYAVLDHFFLDHTSQELRLIREHQKWNSKEVYYDTVNLANSPLFN